MFGERTTVFTTTVTRLQKSVFPVNHRISFGFLRCPVARNEFNDFRNVCKIWLTEKTNFNNYDPELYTMFFSLWNQFIHWISTKIAIDWIIRLNKCLTCYYYEMCTIFQSYTLYCLDTQSSHTSPHISQ